MPWAFAVRARSAFKLRGLEEGGWERRMRAISAVHFMRRAWASEDDVGSGGW
jgi:hypothetical protein